MEKDPSERSPGIAELRRQLRSYQVYLGAALAALGVGTLLAIGLVAFYGLQLAESIARAETRVSELQQEIRDRSADVEIGLARQREDIATIQKAAIEDLEAMREANRKLDSVKDPSKELVALREANERLWQELAKQRAELLDTLRNRVEQPDVSPPPASSPRFRLGETRYVDPSHDPNALKGFVADDKKIFRATAPEKPMSLVIDLRPESVRPGDSYRLLVRLVNHSNRPVAPKSLNLNWSFNGKKTGGQVPVAVGRVGAQGTETLYSYVGNWTEAHDAGPASLTAAVVMPDGTSVTNVLSW